MTEGGAPAWPGAEGWPASPELAATAQHLALLQRKIATLAAAAEDSWHQMLTAAVREYTGGRMDIEQLDELRRQMAANYWRVVWPGGGATGYGKVWDQYFAQPLSLTSRMLGPHVERLRRKRRDDAMTVWNGEFPIEDQLYPPPGTCVVYVLYDAANDPVYVGSTGDFRGRMSGHHVREACEITHWVAYRCRDREHAYQEEERLLATHKPRLNVRSTR